MQTTQPPRRPPTIVTPVPRAHDTELVDTMDDLLAEIDSILEEEERFATRFLQKGGQ